MSRNAFVTESSLLIGGESRTFHIVAELRNDSPGEVEIGEASIRIYDASGGLVGKRSPTPFDKIVPAGGITAVEDQVPSLMYLSDETNDFPEGWATYEVTLSPEYYEPSEREPKPVEVAVQDVEWGVGSLGASVITGSLLNIDDEPAEWACVYAILYASDGRIINAEDHPMLLGVEPLEPGHSIPFEIMFLGGTPLDYARYVVDAYADTGWRWDDDSSSEP